MLSRRETYMAPTEKLMNFISPLPSPLAGLELGKKEVSVWKY